MVDGVLQAIQNDLFVLGADLSTPPDSRATVPRMSGHQTSRLERVIDELDAQVPELRNFILPAGSAHAASLHLARTIARRAERCVITAGETEELSPEATIYLNRLSDLLFVLARWVEYNQGRGDVLWEPPPPG